SGVASAREPRPRTGQSQRLRDGTMKRLGTGGSIVKLAKPVGCNTFDDFCFLVSDGQKADLIDGVIYVASPDNTDSNLLFIWLGGLISLFVETFDLGEVFGLRVALRLDGKNSPEPDILFVRKSRLHLVRRGHVAGAADLAMEIVSPESVERDYQMKRKQY